jgi:polysaccharide biosynthesis transport protein
VNHQQLKPVVGGGWGSDEPIDDRPGRAAPLWGAEEVSVLRETLHVLRRSWRGLAVWLCLCVAAALTYVITATPEFVATTQVVLEPRQAAGAPDAAAVSMTQTLDSAQADSQIPIIQSQRNLRYVFDSLGLASSPEFWGGGFDPIGWIIGHLPPIGSDPQMSPEEKRERADDQAFYKFADGLSVRRLGQSYAFEISYRARSPAKAARLVNAITAAYIRGEVNYNVAAATAQRGGDFLVNRITDANTEMQAAAMAVKTGAIPDMDFGHADARIISAAIPPLTKSYPATTMILLLSFVFALASGAAVVVVRNGLDRMIRSPEQVRRLIGLDVFGVLPGAARGGSLSESVDHPDQPFSKFVRDLRTHVLTAASGPRYPVVGIVSRSCGEGKTLLAANLAYAMAGAGQPVALLDADLRNPDLTRRLAPSAKAGLRDLIWARGTDASNFAAPLAPMLSFVPAEGEGSQQDHNVFVGAPETLQALTGLAQSRTVIIDLPPTSISSEAVALGAALTGVLVITPVNRVTVDELAQLVVALQTRGVRVLGIVLNEGASKWQSFNLLSHLWSSAFWLSRFRNFGMEAA